MKSSTVLFASLACTAAALESCAGKPYDAAEYTCYEGKYLCPVIQGAPTLSCGVACYLPAEYTCSDGQLAQHPAQSGPYEVFVLSSSLPELDGKSLDACGRHFWVNGAGSCTYCPSPPVPRDTCSSVTGTTVFLGSSALSTIVPGGQSFYIEPSGALGFTQAHSASYPTGSTFGVMAYDHGLFVAPRSSGWVACPAPASSNGGWQVFARLEGVYFVETCMSVRLATRSVDGSRSGAWQYV